MADYRKLIPFILKWEGGYADDPADRGGPTNRGITWEAFRGWREKNGVPADEEAFRDLSAEEWERIFKRQYWDRWQADRIGSQPLAELLVDWVWCSGSHGIRIPQQLLGVDDDAVVGPETLSALEGRAAEPFFRDLKQARLDFVREIVRKNPSQRKFLAGWENRIGDLVFNQS